MGKGLPGNRFFIGYTGVIVTTAMWATSGVFIKLILQGSALSEFSLAFYRDILTFLCLFLTLSIFRRNLLRVKSRDLPWFAGLGCIGLGMFHLLWNFGVNLNGVAVSTVQQAIMPIILAVAARFAFGEVLSRRRILAIALTFIGTLLLSGVIRFTQRDLDISSVLVGFAIPLTYAMFNLFSKKIAGRYHPLTILTYGFGFGALILLPVQFLTTPAPLPGPPVFLLIGGLVIVSTLLPFLLYTFLLRSLAVSSAGTLSMAEIPIAFLYAYLIFGELFLLYQLIGTAVIVLGIWLFIRESRRDRLETTPL